MKYFVKQNAENIQKEELLGIGEFLAEEDYIGFNEWLFYYAFEKMLMHQKQLN